MAHWLLKQEPDAYSYADLERDGSTAWDGVSNALALKHLRSVAVGDSVFYYHTGKEKAIVGVARVTQAGVNADSVPEIVIAAKTRLATPVTLAAIKADEAFAAWELVRMSRLSVMPVPAELWARVLGMGGK